MKVLIRTDGNNTIASGHIRRCLSIAEALREKGAEVRFFFTDPQSTGLLEGFCKGDGISFSHTMQAEEADFIFTDSYSFTPDDYKALRRYAPLTGCIDDLCSFDPDVDLVVNYSPAPPEGFYTAGIKLLGPIYAPLRRQFAGCPCEIRPQADRIFIATGGTDPFFVIEKLLKEIYEENGRSDLNCEVMMGSFFNDSYKERLRALAGMYNGIRLNERVSDVAGLMKSCDLAVTAGGTTLYELCASGIPTVVFTMADNQCPFAKTFSEKQAVCYEGDIRSGHGLISRLYSCIDALIPDKEKRDAMHERGLSIVDGRGAERIAEAILLAGTVNK